MYEGFHYSHKDWLTKTGLRSVIIILKKFLSELIMLRKFAKAAFSPRYLFWTNTGLGMSFLVAGDAINQKIVQPRITQYVEKTDVLVTEPLDLHRSKAMVGGGLFFGSVGHFYYQLLDKKFPGHSSSSIKKKLLCEFIAGPPFGFGAFSVIGFLEGKSFEESRVSFWNNLPLLLAGDWGFYVPLQTINFYFLPPQYRFLFVAGLTLIYDTFFSYLLHRPMKTDTDKKSSHESSSQDSPILIKDKVV